MESGERRAEHGELCTCGRQAIVVYASDLYGEVGWCGIGDGGDRTGPCPFCGGPRHTELERRCPQYRLRLEDQPAPGRRLGAHADQGGAGMHWLEPGEQCDRQEVYVAYQITHGRRPDGWWYVVEIPGRPREEHGPFPDEDAVIAAKVARMEELEAGIHIPPHLRPGPER